MTDLKDTKYFEQIVADATLLAAEVEEFNADYLRFWKKNLDELGRILVAHLVVEHYLDEYLTAAFPGIGARATERLGFAKKLDLANFEGFATPLAHWAPGMRALNKIRNQLAHNLDSQISPADTKELQTPAETWNRASGRTVDWSKTDVYQEFSRWAAGFIHSETNAIRRYGKGLGRAAFIEWVKESVSTPRQKPEGGA